MFSTQCFFIMSFKDGNAWALRRAREREQMRLSGDTEQGSLSSLKIGKSSPSLSQIKGKERKKANRKKQLKRSRQISAN